MQTIDFKKILKTGITITSSGTTGQPKKIFQSPRKIVLPIKLR